MASTSGAWLSRAADSSPCPRVSPGPRSVCGTCLHSLVTLVLLSSFFPVRQRLLCGFTAFLACECCLPALEHVACMRSISPPPPSLCPSFPPLFQHFPLSLPLSLSQVNETVTYCFSSYKFAPRFSRSWGERSVFLVSKCEVVQVTKTF